MAWEQGTHNGTPQDVLTKLIAFLTTHQDLQTDQDTWTVLGQSATNIPHPTDDDFTVSKGYYLRGPINDGAPYLFVYAVTSETHAAQAIAFTSMQGFDATLVNTWWAQPGASYDYAPVTVPTVAGRYEFMANGRRLYGYLADNLTRMCPFYAGWMIPYTDTQNRNYVQPTVCLGSDRYLRACNLSTRDSSYAVGLCNGRLSGSNSLAPTSDRNNKGSFLIMPDGRFEIIQAESSDNQVVSMISAFVGKEGASSDHHIKAHSPITAKGNTPLYPEVFRLGNSLNSDVHTGTLLGELDGVVSVGAIGASAGAIIHDSQNVDWVVIKQRNVPSYGIDGYAMKRV